jgi:hypothetical protein
MEEMEEIIKTWKWGWEKWMKKDEVEENKKKWDLKKIFCMNMVGNGNCDWEGKTKELNKKIIKKKN